MPASHQGSSVQNHWRVLYMDAGSMGHFEDIDATSKEHAAWRVAMNLDSDVSTLVEVRAIDGDG